MAKDFKSGFVTIIGRPNVGKSTLLNALLKEKVSIVSPIPQTTRHQIKGILNLENAQVVFVDTPGLHSFKERLAQHLNTIAKKSLEDTDLILYVADVSRKPGLEEKQVLTLLAKEKTKIIMVLNKRDLGENYTDDYVACWNQSAGSNKDLLIYYLPLSAATGKNIDLLKQLILENLPIQHAFYDPGTVTDFPVKFRVADIIREKLYLNLKKELPHAIAVEVESIEEKKTKSKKQLVEIKVVIYVLRNSQKRIIIGSGGAMLKQIGSLARTDIEAIFKKRVFLDIWVEVVKDWQSSERILKQLGYWWA